MSDAMVIDLSNYKDRVGSRVLPGRYRVVVEDVEVDNSKAGNQMINLWLRVQGGEFDGSTLIDRLTITEKALFRIVGFMSALGLPTPKAKFTIQPRKFLGQVLDVDVDDGEPYNGRVKSEIRGYVRVPKGERNSAAPVDLDELADAAPAAPEAAAVAVEEIAPEVSVPASTEDTSAAVDPVNLDDLDL